MAASKRRLLYSMKWNFPLSGIPCMRNPANPPEPRISQIPGDVATDELTCCPNRIPEQPSHGTLAGHDLDHPQQRFYGQSSAMHCAFDPHARGRQRRSRQAEVADKQGFVKRPLCRDGRYGS